MKAFAFLFAPALILLPVNIPAFALKFGGIVSREYGSASLSYCGRYGFAVRMKRDKASGIDGSPVKTVSAAKGVVQDICGIQDAFHCKRVV